MPSQQPGPYAPIIIINPPKPRYQVATVYQGGVPPKGFVPIPILIGQIDKPEYLKALQRRFGTTIIDRYLWAYSNAPDSHLKKWQAQLSKQLGQQGSTRADIDVLEALTKENSTFRALESADALFQIRLAAAYKASRELESDYMWWAGLSDERLAQIKAEELRKRVSRQERKLTNYEAIMEGIGELKDWSDETIQLFGQIKEKPVEEGLSARDINLARLVGFANA